MSQQWSMACPVCGKPVHLYLHYIRPTFTHTFDDGEFIVPDIPKDVVNAGQREVERWVGEQLQTMCRATPAPDAPQREESSQ